MSHLRQLLVSILVIGMLPSTAHAHGVRPFLPYLVLSGLFVGLIAGVVCAVRHLSFEKAILPSFGIYLIIIGAGFFALEVTSWSWSDVPLIVFLSVVFGCIVGFIPLALGILLMSLIKNGIDILRKSRRRP